MGMGLALEQQAVAFFRGQQRGFGQPAVSHVEPGTENLCGLPLIGARSEYQLVVDPAVAAIGVAKAVVV
jgi:hypothetical protein